MGLENTDQLTKVGVQEFRDTIDHLRTILHQDHCSCVSERERRYNAQRAQKVGSWLLVMTCPRATDEEIHRAEVTLDRSTAYIEKYLLNSEVK